MDVKNYLLGLATLPAAFVGLGIADRVVEWVDGRFTFLRPIAHLRPEYQARLITALPPAPRRWGFIIRLPHWHNVGLVTGVHLRPRRKR